MSITPEQEAALEHFLDTWGLSCPYHDIGEALNCGEVEAMAEMLRSFGRDSDAQALIDSHVMGDDEGDKPEHYQRRLELEKQMEDESA